MSECSEVKENTICYQKGDVVWAKVTGYPWWPGRISKIDKHSKNKKINNIADNASSDQLTELKKIYTIAFFGDSTHTKLAQNKLATFQDNFKLYTDPKKKKLMAAVEKAQKYIQRKDSAKKRNQKANSDSQSSTKKRKKDNLSDDSSDSEEEEEGGNKKSSESDNDSKKGNNKHLGKKHKRSENEKTNKDQGSNKDEKEGSVQNNPKEDIKNIKAGNSSKEIINNTHETEEKDDDKGNNANTKDDSKNKEENKEDSKNKDKDDSKNKEESKKKKNKKDKNEEDEKEDDKSSKDNQSSEEQSEESEEEEEVQSEEQATKYLNKLRILANNIMIEAVNLTSQNSRNTLLGDLNAFQETIANIKNCDSPINVKDIYLKLTGLASILQTLAYNNNLQIVTEAMNTLDKFSDFFKDSLFMWKEKEKEDFFTKNDSNDNEDLWKSIDEDIQNLYKKEGSNKTSTGKSIVKNSNESQEPKKVKPIKETIKKGNSFEELIQIIERDSKKVIKEFHIMSEDFFKNVYKKNPHLNLQSCRKRKRICIKLLYKLKHFYPDVKEEDLQKFSIFTEYNSRGGGKDLGDKYCQNIKLFCNKLQETFSENK